MLFRKQRKGRMHSVPRAPFWSSDWFPCSIWACSLSMPGTLPQLFQSQHRHNSRTKWVLWQPGTFLLPASQAGTGCLAVFSASRTRIPSGSQAADCTLGRQVAFSVMKPNQTMFVSLGWQARLQRESYQGKSSIHWKQLSLHLRVLLYRKYKSISGSKANCCIRAFDILHI